MKNWAHTCTHGKDLRDNITADDSVRSTLAAFESLVQCWEEIEAFKSLDAAAKDQATTNRQMAERYRNYMQTIIRSDDDLDESNDEFISSLNYNLTVFYDFCDKHNIWVAD